MPTDNGIYTSQELGKMIVQLGTEFSLGISGTIDNVHYTVVRLEFDPAASICGLA
jgi:hypothetical protein